MHILRGFQRTPWWIELETEDHMVSVHHTAKPFIGSELERDIYIENLIEQSLLQGFPIKQIHCWPMAWSELRV